MIIKIRPGTESDFDAIKRINTEAFGQETEANLVDKLRSLEYFIKDLSSVAVSDDEPIGHIMLTQCELEEYKRVGHKIVMVIGHPNYYLRFVFSQVRASGLETPFEVPDEAFMAAELEPGALEGINGMLGLSPPFDEV